MPIELMTSFVTMVATISRRSGCAAMRWPKRSTTAAGKYSASDASRYGSSGNDRGQHVLAQQPLGVGQEHAQLGPHEPGARRAAARPSARSWAGTRAPAPAARGPRARSSDPRRPPSAAPRPPSPGSGSAPAGSCRRGRAPRRRRRRSGAPRFAPRASARRPRPRAPSRIFRLTSWSEQSTPPELSIASVLIRPPCIAYSIRPRWVRPRLPPSPTTFARSSRPSTRTASFVRSPTSACDSDDAFT